MDEMSRLLRQSNPLWEINASSYAVTITEAGKRIDFYNPVFAPEGEISEIKKITFKLNPNNSRQLLKKEGILESVALANEVEDINFSRDGNIVSLQLTTKKLADFVLNSQVTLRNRNSSLSGDVEVEQPEEGEF